MATKLTAITSPARLIMSAAVALLLIGAGIWWVSTDPLADDDATRIPRRVCDDRISGSDVKPLLPAHDGELKTETLFFDKLYDQGHCELSTENEKVLITVDSVPVYRYPRESTQRQGVPVTLGKAYGYLSDKHSLHLYVPCRVKEETQRVVVGVSSSLHRPDSESPPARARPAAGDDEVAVAAANIAREVTGDWLHCPRADKLPPGPAQIHWP
ncbi:hypothetical protein ACMA1D_19545 [Streptomyces sp. 796.1]|uniref:hypothetical protein n=1 Tax=Streptomyces sp. 796.1 TaxID=3163029 RepID=UPI0039C8EF64